jgi:hypothetical protein
MTNLASCEAIWLKKGERHACVRCSVGGWGACIAIVVYWHSGDHRHAGGHLAVAKPGRLGCTSSYSLPPASPRAEERIHIMNADVQSHRHITGDMVQTSRAWLQTGMLMY